MSDKTVGGWTFKKEVSFGDLIKTLFIAAAFVGWGVTVEGRFTKIDGQQQLQDQLSINLQTRMDRMSNKIMRQEEKTANTLNSLRLEMREGFNRLSDKIDKK